MKTLDSFYTLMSACVSEPMIWANENGPRPKLVFSTLQVTPGTTQPIQRGRVDDEGMRVSYSSRIVEVQVQFYGVNAWGRADAFAMTLMTEAAQDQSEALNIGILSTDRIQSVPSLMDDGSYEDRAIVDLTCHYLGSVEEYVSFIETIKGSAHIDDLPPSPYIASVPS